jgi:hypothetical protein
LYLYLYDVKAKNKREFNRVKRRFYYRLNLLLPSRETWRTKSAILVQGRSVRAMDAFFHSFKGLVVVYKASIRSIEELE